MSSSFNYKKKHRKIIKNNNTLDYIHGKKIDNINLKKNNIETYKKKLVEKNRIIANLNKKSILTEEEIETKLLTLEEISQLHDEINMITNNEEEDDYLLKVGDILFEYYDDSSANNPSDTTVNNSNNNLLDFFKKNNTTTSCKSSNKGKLLNRYLNIIDKSYNQKTINYVDQNKCDRCDGTITVNYIEGISICIDCGEQYNILIDSDKPNYKEPNSESNYFAYKRINHFNEWISQFQAKESTDIPCIVIEKIMLELKKERIYNVANINHYKIRDILKKLKLNKYYEHIPYIINKINGKPPPTISKEVEDNLRYMFKEIQTPFQNHCPKNRKNFLSYSYVIHKFIQILGINEYLVHFPLLKSREKLYQQDKIWKNICKDLKWKFINSV